MPICTKTHNAPPPQRTSTQKTLSRSKDATKRTYKRNKKIHIHLRKYIFFQMQIVYNGKQIIASHSNSVGEKSCANKMWVFPLPFRTDVFSDHPYRFPRPVANHKPNLTPFLLFGTQTQSKTNKNRYGRTKSSARVYYICM